jgi:hypothetical protein
VSISLNRGRHRHRDLAAAEAVTTPSVMMKAVEREEARKERQAESA